MSKGEQMNEKDGENERKAYWLFALHDCPRDAAAAAAAALRIAEFFALAKEIQRYT